MLALRQVRVGRNFYVVRWRYDQGKIPRPNMAQNQLNRISLKAYAHLILVIYGYVEGAYIQVDMDCRPLISGAGIRCHIIRSVALIVPLET